MSILTMDELFNATKAARPRLMNKATLANQTAGFHSSMFRATGNPVVGTIPDAWAICDDTLAGCLLFPAKSVGQDRLIVGSDCSSSLGGQNFYLADRLGHMGGLSGTVTTAQTVNADITGTASNLAVRRGNSDYSNVKWFLEWYTATGATGVNATCNVTYHDATTGTIVVAVAVSMNVGRMLEIIPTNGKFIRSIESVTLSATTGTAGNFGVTALVDLHYTATVLANLLATKGWAETKAQSVEDSSYLFIYLVSTGTSTGTFLGSFYFAIG